MSNGNRPYGNLDNRANRIAGGILIILISTISCLSLFNIMGGVGKMISGFLIGVFGYVAYAYAICGVILGVLMTMGRRPTLAPNKALKYFTLLALGIMIFHVWFSRNYFFNTNYGGYLKNTFEGETAGGWIGSLFAWPVMKLFTPAYALIFFILLFAVVSVLSFYPLLTKLPYGAKKTKIKPIKGKSPVLTDIAEEGRQEKVVSQPIGNKLFVGTLDENEDSSEFKTSKRKKGQGFNLLFPNQDTAGITEDSVAEPVFDSDAERRKRAKEKLFGGKKDDKKTEEKSVNFDPSTQKSAFESEIKPSLKQNSEPFTFNPNLRSNSNNGNGSNRPRKLHEAFNLPQNDDEKAKDLQERFGYILNTPPTANDIRGVASHNIAEPKRVKKTEPDIEKDNPIEEKINGDIPEDMPYFIRDILYGDKKENVKKEENTDSSTDNKRNPTEENVKPSIVSKPDSNVIKSINHTTSSTDTNTKPDDKESADGKGSIFSIFGAGLPPKKTEPVNNIDQTKKTTESINSKNNDMPIKKGGNTVEERLGNDGYNYGYTPDNKPVSEHKPVTRLEELNMDVDDKPNVVMPSDTEIKNVNSRPAPVERPRQPYAPREEKPQFEQKDNSYSNKFPVGSKGSFESTKPEKKKPEQISIDQAIIAKQQLKPYLAPPIDLLKKLDSTIEAEDFSEKIAIVEQTFSNFHIDAKVIGVTQGPTFSRFELQMPAGIPVSTVTRYADDIAMNLQSKEGVRFETPIPGKNAFGIEIANNKRTPVGLRSVLEDAAFNNSKSMLTFGLGRDIGNVNYVCDIESMPHMLIAGSTGSGKSVCINALIISLLYKCGPNDLKLILIDPKKVELSLYNNLPHMLVPEVIDDVVPAVNALDWAIAEMNRRYDLFKSTGYRNIDEYNSMAKHSDNVNKLPRILIIFDELADFMSKMKRQVEDKINSITRLARAAGIHIIVATQRPSVDVITGTIKSNLPSRIAFSVTSTADSMTILGGGGAEKLLGKGDMLYSPQSLKFPVRLQCAYVDGEEVRNIVNYIKQNNEAYFDPEAHNQIFKLPDSDKESADEPEVSYAHTAVGKNGETQQFIDVLFMCVKDTKASISKIQRKFSVGYGTAAKLMDLMEDKGYVSPNKGGNSQRDVLLSEQQFYQIYGDQEVSQDIAEGNDVDG